MEFEVSKRYSLKAYIIHWHGPKSIAVEEAKYVLQ